VVPCIEPMARKVVYDGSTGGLGRHLSQALTEIGIGSTAITSRLGDIAGAGSEFREAGRNADSISFIQTAAMVSVSDCDRQPSNAYQTNVVNTMRTIGAFLDEAERSGLDGMIVYVSSAHVYRQVEESMPVRENTPTDPRSVYAHSKLMAEDELRGLVSERGAKALIARVFGLLGPNQRRPYLLPGLIERARSGEVAGIPGIENVRDYLDARDIAFHLGLLTGDAAALEPGQVEVVNVCSGEGIAIRALLDLVLRAVFPDVAEYRRLSSKVTAAPGRGTDVRWLVGDPTRLLQITGLPSPRRIALRKTIVDAVAA
jgi:nucleoside-diphosphate-sugar epimerase